VCVCVGGEQVRSWLDSVGDAYMSKKELGDSLDSAYSLQEECLNIEAQLMVSDIAVDGVTSCIQYDL